jgi:hypothetical protein
MNENLHFEDVLKRYGKLVYPNKGVSMMPLLRQGRDLMVIERKDGVPFKKYDAVLFKRPSSRGRDDYVLHRILRVNKDGGYWIVGDNCCAGDIVREDQILGTLTAVLRGGRRPSRYRIRSTGSMWRFGAAVTRCALPSSGQGT